MGAKENTLVKERIPNLKAYKYRTIEDISNKEQKISSINLPLDLQGEMWQGY